MYLKTEGLILRQTDWKETDRILNVLTREHGKMTFRARGVRSRRSRLAGSCQLLCYSEFTVFENRGVYTVDEAVPIEMFTELRRDVELVSLAAYFAQAAEVVAQEDDPNPELLSLCLNAMYALGKLQKPQALVKAAFELRLACLAGYTPMVDRCGVCGAEEPELVLWTVSLGQIPDENEQLFSTTQIYGAVRYTGASGNESVRATLCRVDDEGEVVEKTENPEEAQGEENAEAAGETASTDEGAEGA